MNSIPKMRTLDSAFAEIKASDAGTALTKSALRRFVKTGELPAIRVGRKLLIDVDKVFEFLTANDIQQ